MRKFYVSIVCAIMFLSAASQTKVILEQFRTFSMVGPVMKYLSNEETKTVFLKQLNNNLLKHKNAQLNDHELRLIVLPDLKQISSSNVPFTLADSSTWHMYLDLYEFETNTFYFSQPEYKEDSAVFKRTESVFQLGVLLTNSAKEIILNEIMTICVSRGNSSGFGIMAATPSLGSKGFTDMLNLGLGRLLDPENKIAMMEVKAAPVYYADNFILPIIGNHPVIQVNGKNNIASYKRDQTDELIRMGDSFYEQLIVKGKNKNIEDNSLINTAIINTDRQSSSDFVQLRQESRDVLRDKNYTLKMFIEINHLFNYKNEDEAFTSFMPDPIHFLLSDKDTIAKFKINKNTALGIGDRKIYLNKISNGYDSTSIILLRPDDVTRNIFAEYVISGSIRNEPFMIICSDRNMLKEFYLNKKTAAVAMGKFLPERIAVFDASLDKETLNQLMMIGFSRFFR